MKSNLIVIQVVHFHPDTPAFYSQTTRSVLPYRIFFSILVVVYLVHLAISHRNYVSNTSRETVTLKS